MTMAARTASTGETAHGRGPDWVDDWRNMNEDQLPFEEHDPVKAYWKDIDRRHTEQQSTADPEPESPPVAALEVFTFATRHIRTIVINGKRWAVAADICATLEITNNRDALSRLDQADKILLRRPDRHRHQSLSTPSTSPIGGTSGENCKGFIF